MTNLHRSYARGTGFQGAASWWTLWILTLVLRASTGRLLADGHPPNWENPAFANNITIVLAPRTDGLEGIGTSDEPLNASGERFDRIMQQFRSVPGITFLLKPGEYETMAKPEQGNPGTPNTRYWEPYNYWKILGAGTNRTIIRQIGVETDRNTKHAMVYCSRPEPGLLRHFELGHLTLDAQGTRLAPDHSSNFGCVSLDASDVHVHDVVCQGAVNALAHDEPNSNCNAAIEPGFV